MIHRCCRLASFLSAVAVTFGSTSRAFVLTNTNHAPAFRRLPPRLRAGPLPPDGGSSNNMTMAVEMENVKTRLGAVEVDVSEMKTAIQSGGDKSVTDKEQLTELITDTKERLTSLITNSTLDLRVGITGLHGEVGGLHKEIEGVNTKIDEKFLGVNEKFLAVNEKIDEKFLGVDEKFLGVNEKFLAVNEKIDEKFLGVNEKFLGVNEKFLAVNEKIDGVHTGLSKQIGEKFDAVNEKFDAVNEKFDALSAKIDGLAEIMNAGIESNTNATSELSKRLDTRFTEFTVLLALFGAAACMFMLNTLTAVAQQ
jgi:hypothetical protein